MWELPLETPEENPEFWPLAAKLRPRLWQDFVGQMPLMRELGRLKSNLPHLIFWGPPGSGKTTLAKLIAKESVLKLHSFNAVMGGVPELKKLMVELKEEKTGKQATSLLFIDEIHRFNKSQQDALLPFLEQKDFLFIGATTEYPQTSLNRALLSRVKLMELKAHSQEDLVKILARATTELARPDLLEWVPSLAQFSNGDARTALNALEELSHKEKEDLADPDLLKNIFTMNRAYDREDTRHHDVISSFIKSVRGSDPDSALLWLAVMLDGGEDPEFISRRLMILASEDIGLANSQALQVATNAHYVTKNIGMPEARITLSHATVFLALSPKSNSVYMAIDSALEFVKSHPTLDVQTYLKSSGPDKKNYKYAHSYPNHYVKQNYFAKDIVFRKFYEPGELGSEKTIVDIHQKLKGES